MTIRNKLQSELVRRGLWDAQAEQVIKELEADKGSESMKGRWDDDMQGYPPQLMSVLLLSAKQQAVKWIDRNHPKHFARALLSE